VSRAVHRTEFINLYSIYTTVLRLWNWCLGFWTFLISIFVLLFQPLMTHSDELDETTWLVSQLPLVLGCCTDCHQLIMVSFMKLCLCFMDWDFPSINECILCCKKCLYFIKNKLLCCLCCYFILIYWYFVSSWNHKGILHCKWIPKFSTVSSIAITCEHQDSVVFHLMMWDD